MDGVLLINKPKGFTSRDVCNKISKILNEKRVGHIGTLDPFATGLLIVLVGKCTKCTQFFDDLSKSYTATLVLGKETDSLDIDGEVIKEQDVPNLSREDIEKVLNSFLGKQKQIPPMTSAIRVNGKKLYELAHKGVTIDRESRDIEIYRINLVSFASPEIVFSASVSKGTYIRVLGSDIANKLNTVGYLKELNRDEIGPFSVEEAISLDEINENSLIGMFDVLSKISEVKKVDDSLALDIKNGKIKEMEYKSCNKYLFIVDKNDNPIAMYIKINKEKFIFSRGLF